MRYARLDRYAASLLCTLLFGGLATTVAGCSDDEAGTDGTGSTSSSSSAQSSGSGMPPGGGEGGGMPPGGMPPGGGMGGGMMGGERTECGSDTDCAADACPPGSAGCGCDGQFCAPTCAQDSDCPAPPMGQVTCQNGFCQLNMN